MGYLLLPVILSVPFYFSIYNLTFLNAITLGETTLFSEGFETEYDGWNYKQGQILYIGNSFLIKYKGSGMTSLKARPLESAEFASPHNLKETS